MQRVTIADVAAHAGVSTATASRALSGTRAVSGGALRKVTAAAEELGYTGNSIASSLRRSRTDTVGMVVPSIGNPFFTSLVENVEHALQSIGKQLFLCNSRQDPAIEAGHLRELVSRRVDGIIVSPCHGTQSAAAVATAAAAIPVVQLDRHVEKTPTDWVGIDDRHAMMLVLEHLHQRGARSAAFLSSTLTNSSTELRLAGFLEHAARLGISTREDHVLLGEYSVEWGRAATQRLVDQDDLPEALVCADDLIALGALDSLRRVGIEVPGQVRITGYDDIAFAGLVDPALTTVRQPRERIAAEAVRLLQAATRGAAGGMHVALLPELVVRGTS